MQVTHILVLRNTKAETLPALETHVIMGSCVCVYRNKLVKQCTDNATLSRSLIGAAFIFSDVEET